MYKIFSIIYGLPPTYNCITLSEKRCEGLVLTLVEGDEAKRVQFYLVQLDCSSGQAVKQLWGLVAQKGIQTVLLLEPSQVSHSALISYFV